MKKIELIIAEDHLLYRETVVSALNKFNIFSIREAGNGVQLLNELEIVVPDIILLDLEMPVMDGNAALKLIKEQYPSVKTIIFSQYDSPTIIQNYLDKGAHSYLSKLQLSDINVLKEELIKISSQSNDGPFLINTPDNKLYTRRELEIIPLICHGKTTKEIAMELSIGKKAVEKHRNNLYKKTDTKSFAALLRYFYKEGFDYL